jgi:hypothetical protein
MTKIASGPDWASIMTAIGTVALAIVTVSTIIATIVITKQDRQRSDKQLADAQIRHDKEVADERALAYKRLTEQLAHSDAQLADERAHSAAQLQEERQRSHQAEQRGEAFAVLVTPGRIPANLANPAESAETGEAEERPVAVVINNGRFTITNLDARFARNSILYQCQQMEYYSAYPTLPEELVSGLVADPAINILPPGFAGVRFIGGSMAAQELRGINPIVRWTDSWGTRWEHKVGQVRSIAAEEPWEP